MISTKSIISEEITKKIQGVTQGDCVHLRNNQDLFQVIGIDNKLEKCWVRKWPLNDNGSPVFEISIQQICFKSTKN